jgi:hypothetical protein
MIVVMCGFILMLPRRDGDVSFIVVIQDRIL